MQLHSKLVCFLVLLGSLSPAYAADIYVISNSGVKIPDAQVADVFTGDMQTADGKKLVPVDNAALQGEFLSKVLGMSSDKYTSNWRKRAFRDGLNAPETKSSDAEVIGYVKSTPGAVGYVESAPAGVNVIKKY